MFDHLDYRERNGYERVNVNLEMRHCNVDGCVYIAPIDNHAFLGEAPLEEMVEQIRRCAGPSGANIDYVLQLADALRALNAEDAHVFEVEAAVRES